MSPIIGVIVLFWILRALNNSGSSQSSTGQSGSAWSGQIGSEWRATGGTNVSAALLMLFLKVVVVVIGVGPALALATDHTNHFVLYVVYAVAVPYFLPSLFLQCVLVPLGLYRLAYWWVRCTWPFGFDKEFRTGAVYYGTLALACKPATAQQIDWLQKRLPSSSVEMAAHVVTVALLAAMAGERDTARTMLHSIDVTRGPRGIRCAARDWLVADSASRGDWQAVARRGRRGRDSFRWSYAVARMAERFNLRIQSRANRSNAQVVDRPAEAAPNWLLTALWLLAPRRRRTLPLLRAALAVPRAAKGPAAAWPVRTDLGPALGDLAGMLLHMSKTGQEPEREYFLAIVHAASTQVDSPQTRAHVQQRLKALDPLRNDAPDTVETIVRGMHQQLVDMVVPIIDQAPHLNEGDVDSPVLREAIDRIRQSALQDIEMRCRDYAQRTESETSMEQKAEWSAWAALQKQANHLLKINGGADDALFQTMYGSLCNFAVHQHNVLKRHRLAHDMFLWLKHHSKSNPDADAILTKNVAAYPLRWQEKRLTGYEDIWQS